jgi:hypothetical protein
MRALLVNVGISEGLVFACNRIKLCLEGPAKLSTAQLI